MELKDDVVGSQRGGELGISFLTYIIISFVVLIFEIFEIYFYLFKLKRYDKEDKIRWIEFGRDMISMGSSI